MRECQRSQQQKITKLHNLTQSEQLTQGKNTHFPEQSEHLFSSLIWAQNPVQSARFSSAKCVLLPATRRQNQVAKEQICNFHTKKGIPCEKADLTKASQICAKGRTLSRHRICDRVKIKFIQPGKPTQNSLPRNLAGELSCPSRSGTKNK